MLKFWSICVSLNSTLSLTVGFRFVMLLIVFGMPFELGASVKKAAQQAEREMLQWTITPKKDFVCQQVVPVEVDSSTKLTTSDESSASGMDAKSGTSDKNYCLTKDRAIFLKRNRFNQITTNNRTIVIDLAGVSFQVRFERKLVDEDLASRALAGYLADLLLISGPGIYTNEEKLTRLSNPVVIIGRQASLHQLRFIVPKGWKDHISADTILFTRTKQGSRIHVSVKTLQPVQIAAGVNALLAKILPDQMLSTLAQNQPDPEIVELVPPHSAGQLYTSSAKTDIDRYTFRYVWFVDPKTNKAYTFYTWWRTKKKHAPVQDIFAALLDSVEFVAND